MPTVILVLTLFTLGVETGSNTVTVVKAIKAVHHHFVHPIYSHTIKPIVKAVKPQS